MHPILNGVFFASIFCCVNGQYYPNSRDRGRQNYGSRGVPNPDYDRYSPNGRFGPWNSDRINFLHTGMHSRHSDSRCRKGFSDQHMEEYLGSVTVQTLVGNIEGSYVYLCDGPGVTELYRPKDDNINRIRIYRNLTVFLGIPYAKPPTRENGLRFKPPQFYPSFTLLRALEYKKACPQPTQYYGIMKGVNETSEDCLYLNVFSPCVGHRCQNEKYAVIIYIHGGNWDHGSANVFPAQMLAASQEVVVVTFNYRLGPLGFFATGDNSSAGNYGLLDQAMAIDWVYDNIEAFNGDPKKITLFGTEAGAASAGIHMLTDRLRLKVKRVIAQSGSAVARWASLADQTIIYNNSAEFAKSVQCFYPSTSMMVNCLKELSLSRFEVANLELPKVGWVLWAPVVDGYTRSRDKQALPAAPKELLDFGLFDYLDGYMSGVTKSNGLHMMLSDAYLQRNNYRITEDFFKRKIEKYAAKYNYTLDPEILTQAIQFLYVPCDEGVKNFTLMRENYVDMYSDSYFKAPNDEIVRILVEKNVKTYTYVLNSVADGMKQMISRDPIRNTTVPHDTEYYFITGAPFMDPSLYPREHRLQSVVWTEADRNMSQFFMTAWANFAKFGNPTPTTLFDSIVWKKTDLKTMQYLSINTTNCTTVMMHGYRLRESRFWNEYLPNLMQLVTPTWPPFIQPWEEQRNIYAGSLYGVLGAILFCLAVCLGCSVLYCRAKSTHFVSTEDIPDAPLSTAPSSIDTLLSMRREEPQNRFLGQQIEMERRHTAV